MRRRLFRAALAALVVTAVPLGAQSAAVKAGAESITEGDLKKHLYVIADDSMLGRDTPSKGLEMTARYIADNFKRFGLAPGGDSGSWLQRYGLSRRKIDGEKSSVIFSVNGKRSVASFARDGRFAYGPRNGAPITAPVVLVGGAITPETIKSLEVKGKVVVAVYDFSRPGQAQQAALRAIWQKRPAAIVTISNRDAQAFSRSLAPQFVEQLTIGDGAERDATLIVEAHERALGEALAAAGVDLAAVRGSPTLVSRPLPALTTTLTIQDVITDQSSAPNVVGVLEGSDPVLRNEYVVISAHMDHVGVDPSAKGDSIFNGADDDASGTVGVLELAEAYSRPGARPKRSMIFLAVSGEEKGLWGSDWFAGHSPVPLEQIVANLNIDMIGRNWKDTIVVIGKEHSDLGATLNRVNAAHPELGMKAIDDIWPQENFYSRSDHFNFARRGIPVLFFFNGTHADYHESSDAPDKIDYEKEARIVRLIYYIGQEIGNAAEKPKWNPESFKKIVGPER